MKKNFRLQKVLEYRERVVELEKNKLAELNNKLFDVNAKILDMTNSIELKMKEREVADNSFLLMYDKFIAKLEQHKKNLIKMRKQVELNIELQKKKVMEAMERHKVMLKLKEKHVENYRIYLNKEEAKFIDELAVMRSGRNND
jgi:flagellar FliJ protein